MSCGVGFSLGLPPATENPQLFGCFCPGTVQEGNSSCLFCGCILHRAKLIFETSLGSSAGTAMSTSVRQQLPNRGLRFRAYGVDPVVGLRPLHGKEAFTILLVVSTALLSLLHQILKPGQIRALIRRSFWAIISSSCRRISQIDF